MSIKIATWNVNSIKMRADHVEDWLKKEQPDILFLQELKGTDFPAARYEALGYHCRISAQKTYNGVATLSKEKQQVIYDSLPKISEAELDETPQARYLESEAFGLRLINIYLPNGNPVDSEKFSYKLKWMDTLYERIDELRRTRIPFVIGGDFNIIPEDKDCHDPKAWAGDALFHEESLKQWRRILYTGLTDAYRVFHNEANRYTFWDYQGGAWPQDKGIRIDHFLTSPAVTDRLRGCEIDHTPRGWDKPSDHTPIWIEVADD